MRCRNSPPISRNRRLSPVPFDQVEAAPAHAGLSQIHRGTRSQRGLAGYVQWPRKDRPRKDSALRFWKRARLKYPHEAPSCRRSRPGNIWLRKPRLAWVELSRLVRSLPNFPSCRDCRDRSRWPRKNDSRLGHHRPSGLAPWSHLEKKKDSPCQH
jgi:hypothetical protein